MDTIKIVIVDNHPIIRDGLKVAFNNLETIEVVGEAGIATEVIELVEKIAIDVILMDISLKGDSLAGIKLTEKVLGINPDIKVIAYSTYEEKSVIHKMVEAGASGYVLKDYGLKTLIEAISEVHQGGNYFSHLGSILLGNKIKQKKGKSGAALNHLPPKQLLTRREIEVLKLIALEFTSSEIAEKLFIADRTVEAHRQNIKNKLGAKSKIGMARYALDHGLLDEED